MRKVFVVCYDICDQKRLRKVFKTMKDWGDHIQYSVFECRLTKQEKMQLQMQLKDTLHHDEDQVLFINLGPAKNRGSRAIESLGRPYSKLDSPCLIV